VVAGSVVGQWGPNYGGGRGRISGGNRVRGTRAGKKNKEKKEQKEDKRAGDEDDNNDKNEDVKIMTVKEVLSKDKKNLIANEE